MLIQPVVIEPNRFAAEHNQLLLTLGLALFLENLALVLWQGDFRTVRPAYASASFVVGEALVEVPRLVACGGAIVMAVVLFAFLKLTDVGKAIRALSEEPEGAMLMGINVSRIRAAAFGIGAGAVAVAGALVTPFFYVAPDVGESFTIMAFVVVVLGGMGNFVGALLGGFIVGLAESLGATLLPGSLKQLVVFALFGLFAGYLSFRYGLRGPYFSLVTLAFAEMLRVVAVNTKAVGSSIGLVIPNREPAPVNFVFAGKLPYYYVILAMALAAVWITRRVARSKLGYSLLAIRENEDAAEASGVDALGMKLRAMAISSFLTAVGGTFYSQYFAYIDPTITFGPSVSIQGLLQAIVGGAGTVLGPVIGAFVLTAMS